MLTLPDDTARDRHAFIAVARSVAQFLRDHDERFWSESIGRLADRAAMARGADDLRDVASQALRMFGGMGSFNDLMLSVDGMYPRDVNGRLDALRSDLYAAARALIPSH